MKIHVIHSHLNHIKRGFSTSTAPHLQLRYSATRVVKSEVVGSRHVFFFALLPWAQQKSTKINGGNLEKMVNIYRKNGGTIHEIRCSCRNLENLISP